MFRRTRSLIRQGCQGPVRTTCLAVFRTDGLGALQSSPQTTASCADRQAANRQTARPPGSFTRAARACSQAPVRRRSWGAVWPQVFLDDVEGHSWLS